MFRTGYILDRRTDLIFFLGLPFVAIAAAFASQQWLTGVAVVSIGMWITAPHHFATWLRTYGMRDEWHRWKDRLIIGPLIITLFAIGGLKWAPLTLVLLVTLWDNQHSLMQQYGFSRIYDFKARTGAPSTGKFDLYLNWILFANLFFTAPLFARFWVRELYRLGFPISASGVQIFQTASYAVTVIYGCVYLGHLVWCLQKGYGLNPIKYAFLSSSYFLWYLMAWQTDALLVFVIAHRIMHGVQYIVMVHYYIRRKEESHEGVMAFLTKPVNVWAFVIMCGVYAVLYALLIGQPLEGFGFGIISFTDQYKEPLHDFGIATMSVGAGYDLFAVLIVQSVSMVHYYFDSFIWKVRDTKVQAGL